ncbi:hypothetical protein ACJ73_08402 [Blastomyces percursus]|uniref:Fungal-type protein kinase domain-containing protein n=1 Tax=Blastomyces percursus TaxID=1658174 RepID=A0A1J9PV50_9EURO|nr:hypothetical protein ACJ73_08402 [Blastomyces percursus]
MGLVVRKTSDFDIWNSVLGLIANVSQATPPPRPIVSFQQTPWLFNTSKELGDLHADIPGFLETYFGIVSGLDSTTRAILDKCMEGDRPLYNEEKGWRDWPEHAVEKEVLRWLADVITELVQFAEADDLAQKINRRLFAQPTRPLEGSIATRKLDIGFVNDSTSESFDINTYGLRFIAITLGFLLMSPEQLGFDPTIITIGDKRCIEVEKDGRKERFVIDGVIGRARCISGRATTCWKVHRDDDPRTPLVVKDSWQYPEHDEEGELLRQATESGSINVARYYHHETVRINGKSDDILGIRRGLSIPTLKFRSSDCVDTLLPLPPSKRTQSISPTKSATNSTPLNRVHRRVTVQDYGKPIYESSSRVALLSGLEGCIRGYNSLYRSAGIIQCDISPRNLHVNEDDNNPSWRAFLIDLDLAIRWSGKVVKRFEEWNYVNTEKLADEKKGVVNDEGDFLRIAEENFTPYYQPLASWVNRLRRVVFPGGGRWKKLNPHLSSEMVDVLQRAQSNLNVIGQGS